MTNVFFSSDTHDLHGKIIGLANRPCETVEEMTEMLVDAWNSVVHKQDHVYHLGDLSFGNADQAAAFVRRLRGNIHFVEGNHDDSARRAARKHPRLFTSYQQYKEIRVGEQRIVMFHFPITSWHLAHRGSWHLHGHTHGNLDPAVINGPMLDVGVDAVGFAPISFDEVRQRLEGREWTPIDQHNTNKDDE